MYVWNFCDLVWFLLTVFGTGDAVVGAYSDSMQKRHKKIGSRVLSALLLDTKKSDENNGTTATSKDNIQEETSLPDNKNSSESIDDEEQDDTSLWREILNVFVLEAPILAMVIALAMLVGHSEGWDWQVR